MDRNRFRSQAASALAGTRWPVGVSTRRIGAALALAAVGFAVVFVVCTGTAPAQETPTESTPAAETAEANIDIDILVQSTRPGDPVLLRLTVRAERAIAGQLVLAPQENEWGGPPTIDSEYRWDIDAAANTEVETFAAMNVTWDTNAVEARLISGDRVIADRTKTVGLMGDGDEKIATFGIASDPRIELIGDSSAKVTSFDGLTFTPSILDSFSTVVADPATVASLESTQRDVLVGWLLDGGQLALPNGVDDLEAAGLASVEAFRSASIVGDGVVVELTNADKLVDDELLPNGQSFDEGMFFGPGMWGDPVASLANRAGLELASLKSLGIFLGVYVLVAGPLAFAVCRQLGRPRLMWLVLPGVALAFTGVAAATGSVVRSAGHDEHTTIVMSGPIGSRAESYLLTRSGEKIPVDRDWWIAPTHDDFGMLQQGPGSLQFDVGADQSIAAVNVPGGSAALLSATGPVPDADGALEVVVSANDNETITGTITNNLAVDLHDTIIVWDGGSVDVDTLAAGESRPFTIEHKAPPTNQWGEVGASPEQIKWGMLNPPRNGPGPMAWDVAVDVMIVEDDFGSGLEAPQEGTVADGNIWMLWRTDNSSLFSRSQLVAIGWTAEMASPTADIASGRTAYVATAAATSSDAPRYRMVDVTNPDEAFVDDFADGPMMGPPLFRSRYRVDFAEPITAGDWGLAVGRSVAGVEFEIDGTSRSVIFGDDDEGALTVAFPDEIDGATSVIVTTAVSQEGPMAANAPTLAYRDPEAVSLKLNASDDPTYRDVPFGGFDMPADALPDMAPGEQVTVPPLSIDEPYIIDATVLEGTANSYTIELNSNADITVDMIASDPQLDPFVELRDMHGDRVASNDDIGNSFNASISYEATEAGSYEIRASGVGLGGGYELTITLNDEGDAAGIDPPDPNEGDAGAEPLPPSELAPSEPVDLVPTEAPGE